MHITYRYPQQPTITFIVVSSFLHPVSYFAPHSPEIADNEEELSDSHSFDEQIHAMNENIGGNVADNTSEVEMVEKLQNQETYFHAYLGLYTPCG